jgi:hypothetical protein
VISLNKDAILVYLFSLVTVAVSNLATLDPHLQALGDAVGGILAIIGHSLHLDGK